jgi:uncharacterized Zn-finger protein
MTTEHDKAMSACTEKKIEITSQDLPLSCPMPNQAIWNAHPKVYLPIHKTGAASCPYCSTQYILTDFVK